MTTVRTYGALSSEVYMLCSRALVVRLALRLPLLFHLVSCVNTLVNV